MPPKALCLLLLEIALVSGSIHAAEVDYTGVSGGEWATESNWNGGLYPGSSDVANLDTTANLSVSTSNSVAGIRVGSDGDGRLQIGSLGALTANASSTVVSKVGDGPGNSGYVQQEGGTVAINSLEVGNNSATGTYSIHSGSVSFTGENSGNSLVLAGSGSGEGTFRISSGRLSTRAGVQLGSAEGGVGRFEVVGSHPSSIAIGNEGASEGSWRQHSGSILSVRIDKTGQGVTPIFVRGPESDVVFEDGALLEVDFIAAFLNGGAFTVMEWEGDVTDHGLQFAPSVDTNIWSFQVDAASKRLIVTAVGNPISRDFVHPGLGHNRADLQRMRDMVAARIEPYYSSFLELSSHPGVSEDYVPPSLSLTAAERETVGGSLENEGWQAYRNALMWVITGEERHAELCVSIFNAWSGLKRNKATVPLSTARHWRLIEAAEIIRSTYDGWEEADIQAFKDMLVYPGYSNTTVPTEAIENGDVTLYWRVYQGDPVRHGNQGLFCMRMLMAMGVFLDNQIMYDRGLRYLQGAPSRADDIPYPSGAPIITGPNASSNAYFEEYSRRGDDGTVPEYGYNEALHNYIWPNGQNQESSRDQGHGYAGTSVIGTMAEIAWNQGDDLYGHLDNRLLLGMEYLTRYNLSYDVSYPDQPSPWEPTVESGEYIQRHDRSGRWFSLAINPYLGADLTTETRRARLEPVYEANLAHYRDRIGLPSEDFRWLERGLDYLVEQIGVEGPGKLGDLASHGGLTYRRVSPGDPIQGFVGDLPVFAMNELPTTIEAENYDHFTLKGEGRTYHDKTLGNSGSAYRLTEGVDVSSLSSGGYAVSSIESGEWLTFTVSAPVSGNYDISIRYASMAEGGTIQFSFAGEDLTGALSIPHGGTASTGASDWKELVIATDVPLSQGVQQLKLAFGGASRSFLLDKISIEQLGDALLVYKHTAGSRSPDLVANGVSSSARLGGNLAGETADESADQLSAELGLSVSTNDFSNYFSYDVVSHGNIIEYRNLALDAFAQDVGRLYQLSYIISGQPEVFITDGPIEAGDLSDAGHFAAYGIEKFSTASDVEFRVYWQGSASGASSDRVYVNEFRINSLDEPVAVAQTVLTPLDTAIDIELVGDDLRGADLSFTTASSPANGSLSGSGRELTYTPDAGFVGADSFSFAVSNGSLTSEKATVTIEVEAPALRYRHGSGSTSPDLQREGMSSTAGLGGNLSGSIATSIDQLSVALANGLPLSIPETDFNHYFTYTVSSGGNEVEYGHLSLDVYAKDTARRYQLSYVIAGEAEVFLTNGATETGSLTDAGKFDDYDFSNFSTASDVEFRIYWQGDASDSSNARVYVDEFRLFSRPEGPLPIEAWRQLHFETVQNAGDAADQADPDGDELVNLLEFAFGTDPNNSDVGLMVVDEADGSFTSGAPMVLVQDDLQSAALRFVRRVDHLSSGIVYTVQYSHDLKTWVDVDGGVAIRIDGTSDVDGYEAVELDESLILANGRKVLFYRIQVSGGSAL